jgi:hypothetical protein
MLLFEMVVKRKFNGNPKEIFAFSVPGIPDNEDLSVRRGRLHVTGQEIVDLSTPVLRETRELVEHQIRVSKNRVKSIFLVGGFGQSPLLLNFLRDSLPSEITIPAPVDG